MKKFLMIALFALGLLGLSVTASYAGANCAPGCDCPTQAAPNPPAAWAPGGYAPAAQANGMMNHSGVLGLLENHSNTMRLRDKSYGRQMVFQNDNGIGMTCFDHALALTSRLGPIFSDAGAPNQFPAANSTVFLSPIYSPAAGNDKFLLDALNTVVTPQISNHENDFTNSLSNNLGATMLSGFLAAIMAAFNGLLGPVNAAIAALNTAISTFNTAVNLLKNAIRILSMVIGVPAYFIVVQGFITAINAALAAVKAIINGIVKAAQTLIRTAVQALLSWLMGGATSMAAASGTGTGECDRIQELWGNGQPGTFQTNASPDWERALTSTGRQGGTPYFSFGQLLSMAPPGAGANLLSELTNGSNSGIVNGALADIGAGGGLNKPGNILTWPTSPPPPIKSFMPGGQTPAMIIGNM
jgi:hypothetical protein